MALSRREMLKNVPATAAWLAAFSSARAIAQQSTAAAEGETNSVAFWDQFFESKPQGDVTTRGLGRQSHSSPAPAGSQVEYVHLGPRGLRYVQDIAPQELAPINGDVLLSVSPAQFRLGHHSEHGGGTDEYLHSAQLRFDIHQSQGFLNVLPLLAWTSLAAVFPAKSGRLPSIQQLNFTSPSGESAVDKVLLPGGSGKFAVNVSAAKKSSVLYTVLQDIAQGARVLNPILGLPAISIAALQAFTALYAEIEQRTTFLMSSAPVHVAVTQDAWNSSDRPAQAVPLPPGDYLLFPKDQAEIIRPEFDKLTLENGYVVTTSADKGLPIPDRAEQAVKGLTYITMRLSVSEVAVPSHTTKAGDQMMSPCPTAKPASKKKE
jgi:hypothetical protein